MALTFRGIATRVRTEGYAWLARNRTFFVDMDYPKAKLELYQGIRFNSCSKEPETVRWMESFGKHDVVYDIGACVGAYSLVASRQAKVVYAFEPAYFNYDVLMRNIQRNVFKGNIPDNVIAVPNPLAEKTGVSSFNYLTTAAGSAMHVFGRLEDYNGNRFEPEFSQPMCAFSLDDFVSCFSIPYPTHIKLDVDGNELDILKGASHVLKSRRLKSILVEIGIGRSDRQIVALLKSYGFRVSRKVVRRKEIANYIFRRCR